MFTPQLEIIGFVFFSTFAGFIVVMRVCACLKFFPEGSFCEVLEREGEEKEKFKFKKSLIAIRNIHCIAKAGEQ